MVNCFAYSIEIPIDLHIWNSNDSQLITFQIRCTLLVIFCCFILIMLASIQFKDQPGFCTIKVGDVSAKDFLPCKLDWIVTKEIIP